MTKPSRRSWRFLAWSGATCVFVGVFLPYADVLKNGALVATLSLMSRFEAIGGLLILMSAITAISAAVQRPGLLWLSAPFSFSLVLFWLLVTAETVRESNGLQLDIAWFFLLGGALLMTVAARKGEAGATRAPYSGGTPPPSTEAWLVKSTSPPGHSAAQRAPRGRLELSNQHLAFRTSQGVIFDAALQEVRQVRAVMGAGLAWRRGHLLWFSIAERNYSLAFMPVSWMDEGLVSLENMGFTIAHHLGMHTGAFGAALLGGLADSLEAQSDRNKELLQSIRQARRGTELTAKAWSAALEPFN